MKDWIKEYGAIVGVLTLTVPIFGYLCAYLYELGFCGYFGIPSVLIQIGWERFVWVAIMQIWALIVLSAWALFAANFFHMQVNKNRHRVLQERLYIYSFNILLVCFTAWGTYSFSSFKYGVTVTSCMACLSIMLVIYCFFHRLKSSTSPETQPSLYAYLFRTWALWMPALILVAAALLLLLWRPGVPAVYKVIMGIVTIAVCIIVPLNSSLWKTAPSSGKALQDTSESNLHNLIWNMRLSKLDMSVAILMIIIIMPLLFYFYGHTDAVNNVTYNVISENQSVCSDNDSYTSNIVVLRVYGDNAICVPLTIDDESGNYTVKQFTVVTLDNIMHNITLIPVEVGPLHMQ